jgi:hypothetical protein
MNGEKINCSSHAMVALAFVVMLSLLSSVVAAQRSNDGIHNQLVVLEGTVTELNNRDLGNVPANTSVVLIFRREGCDACLIAVNPDLEGRYRIRVGVGKYRLIVTNPAPPEQNLLAPQQATMIDLSKKGTKTVQFDIRLKFPEG